MNGMKYVRIEKVKHARRRAASSGKVRMPPGRLILLLREKILESQAEKQAQTEQERHAGQRTVSKSSNRRTSIGWIQAG